MESDRRCRLAGEEGRARGGGGRAQRPSLLAAPCFLPAGSPLWGLQVADEAGGPGGSSAYQGERAPAVDRSGPPPCAACRSRTSTAAPLDLSSWPWTALRGGRWPSSSSSAATRRAGGGESAWRGAPPAQHGAEGL